MKPPPFKSTALTAGMAASLACALPAHAQSDDPLLDALVKKGILTQQEAEDIRAEVVEPAPEPTQWKVNTAFGSLEFFGDARLRYELREGQDDASDTFSRERFRYRLRFGVKGDYRDDFYYGLRLETSSSSRSTNVTLGDDGGAPSNKDSDRIHVGQLYLGWRGLDWAGFEVGRVANPLITSSMVWDGDINPEGAVERFRHKFGDVEVFATLGQWLYDDVNPENPFGAGGTRTDAFLLAWQTGAKYQINDTLAARVAPTLYNYTGTGDYGGPFGAGNVTGINDLMIVEVPFELTGRLLDLPVRLFGDFAINLDADDRATAAGFAGSDDQNKAWQIGVGVGQAKKKGGWEARAFWQRSELFALDPNLVDSDFFDSRLNMEGIGIGLSYAITDNIGAHASYACADRADDDLPVLGGGDIGGSGFTELNDYQLLQLDLTWKF
jgi:hypothetical protein